MVIGGSTPPHALERLVERGATDVELTETVEKGEQFPAKFGRTGFRRNFPCDGTWQGRSYSTKQLEAYAVREGEDWVIITVITKFF